MTVHQEHSNWLDNEFTESSNDGETRQVFTSSAAGNTTRSRLRRRPRGHEGSPQEEDHREDESDTRSLWRLRRILEDLMERAESRSGGAGGGQLEIWPLVGKDGRPVTWKVGQRVNRNCQRETQLDHRQEVRSICRADR